MTERADSDQVAKADSNKIKVQKAYEAVYELTVKKSRFICHLFPVRTEEEAAVNIASIKKRYYDASHNCYAYVTYDGGTEQKKFSDDGEPKGTAGLPILKMLETHSMFETLAIVTRYFGGTLLGTGGLARAYAEVVSEGLAAAGKVRLVKSSRIHMILNYHDYTNIENMLKDSGIKLSGTDFRESVEISFYVPADESLNIVRKAEDRTDGRAFIEVGESEIREVTL